LSNSLILSIFICSTINRKFIDNVKVFDHLCEFVEANFPIVILVGLDNGSVDQLLELHIIQIVSNHHFEDGEKFTVGDVPVTIDVINLESKS
jgi:hypothetical protein